MRPLRSQELVESIIALIDREGLGAGDPLPPEHKLMTEFDAARNSVREAVRTLQALGIVDIRHGHGTFVGTASMTALIPSLLFRTRARSREDLSGLHDLMEVRQILETDLTQRVAAHPPAHLLDALQECVERMRVPGTAPAADREFHQLIGAAAGNDLALELIRLFWEVYQQAESLVGPTLSTSDTLVAKHQRIVDAIRGGERTAITEAVRHHFDEIRERIEAREGRPVSGPAGP
ncbi:FadR/GntR family transcriptional regulator [Amycolatopsis samaneae]|uniref:FadR/GntR family transcriptional regulator n=1 Tax=Amycolatopsis samaneae TaxID=664691 RepID=A0ABW5GHG7_9PSEU